MEKKINIIMLCLLLVAASGCASIEVKKINDNVDNDGIIFYQPDFYILVSKNEFSKKDNQTMDVKYEYQLLTWPNKNKAYAIRMVPGLGSVNMNVTLADGWRLSSLNTQTDSKVAELLGGVAAIGALIPKKRPVEEEAKEVKPEPLSPGLYRIDFKNGQISGLTRVNLKIK